MGKTSVSLPTIRIFHPHSRQCVYKCTHVGYTGGVMDGAHSVKFKLRNAKHLGRWVCMYLKKSIAWQLAKLFGHFMKTVRKVMLEKEPTY